MTRGIVDITSPDGWEVNEVGNAKDEVYALIYDWFGGSYASELPKMASSIVELLIDFGWRPTWGSDSAAYQPDSKKEVV